MNALKLLLALIAVESFSNEKYWSYTELKLPTKNSNFCKVSKHEKSYICDPHNYLDISTKKAISSNLEQIKLKSPNCVDKSNKKLGGFVIGVIVISRISEYQPSCNVIENFQDCFSRNILKDWDMSHCGNEALIVLEEGHINPVAHLYFGTSVHKSLSHTCINRIRRDVSHSLKSSINLQSIIHRIYLYTTDTDYCIKVDEHKSWEMKTELLIGLIIGTACIIVLIVFLVPYWRRRASNDVTQRRNSNIVRPLNGDDGREESDLPPKYTDLMVNIEKEPPKIVIVGAAPDSIEPPSYVDVIRSTNYSKDKSVAMNPHHLPF